MILYIDTKCLFGAVVHLSSMFLDCGRYSKHLEETHTERVGERTKCERKVGGAENSGEDRLSKVI